MNYPVWYLPEIGGGFLIALIAILHVFVSHFAVGGGLYLIYCEKKGLREHNDNILEFTRRHARFFLLITMVFGSITGVGIWFIIALVNPAATSLLIHTFVFGWAAEWVFFVVEIAAAFIYFYMFGKMDSSTHLKIGWIYFISAWMSLLLINGIISFMLTPGGWLGNNNFWIGFFNPSFLPSLCFRTFIAVLLAGVFGYLTSSFTKNDSVRLAMTRFSGKWALFALVGTLLSALWYAAILPDQAKGLVMGKSPTIAVALQWGAAGTVALLVISLIAGIIRPALNVKPVAFVSMLCALVVFGAFEWTREAARRPYAINNVIYSNSILQRDLESISKQGFLTSAKWVQNRTLTEETALAAGEEIFVHQCYACHTMGGFNNDLKAQTANMSFGSLISYINRIHQVRYFMPPFAGTRAEVAALATYIAGGVHGKDVGVIGGSETTDNSGPLLFENHCSACHDTADLGPTMMGMSALDIKELLSKLNEISDEMVPFDGTDEEGENLSLYLYSLNNAAVVATPEGFSGEVLFENNCSACHAAGDMPDYISEWDETVIREALDKLDELSDEMLPYEGSTEEKDVLAAYLNSLKGGK